MIVARIELHPAGGGSARKLMTLHIVNVGGTEVRGDYRAALLDAEGNRLRTATVTGWTRLGRDAAALVHEALSAMGYGGERGQ